MAAFRAMTPTERLTIADQLSSDVRALAKAGIRSRRPNATPDEVDAAFAELLLGPEFAVVARRPARRKAVSFADLLPEVIAHLDRSGIPFMVTGSLASSFHGEPRATRDLDMVIDPTPRALSEFVRDLLASGFYVDEQAADAALTDQRSSTRSALMRRKSTSSSGGSGVSIAEFDRRMPANLLGTPGYIATAEDLVIAKLEWAKATDSERQRRDVLGIVAVADALDEDYIQRWATALDLLDAWRDVLDETREL